MPNSESADPADPLAWITGLEGVPSAFAATRDGIDTLLRDRGLRRTDPGQTAASLLRGAQASAELEGSTGEVEQAAVRISTELLSLAPVLERSPSQAFSRLHVLATGSGDGGRPAGPAQAERMAELSRTLATARTTPALVVAALAHAEIATVRPFGSLDGLVARAVERLLLVTRGVDPASVVVPEAGHLALRGEYESNLRGYATGGRAGLHAWLLYAAEAYARGAEESPLAR